MPLGPLLSRLVGAEVGAEQARDAEDRADDPAVLLRVRPLGVGRGRVDLGDATAAGLLEDLVADPAGDRAADLREPVQVVGPDLALGAALLPAPLGQLAGEDAEVELEAEVLRRLVREPVDELRREQLVEPLLRLTGRELDLVAAVELDRLEDLRLALALIAAPVVHAAAELLRPAAEHRHVADALGDPADHQRVLQADVDELLSERRLVAEPADGAAGEAPGERPHRVLDRARLLGGRQRPRPRVLGPQLQAALVGVLLQPPLGLGELGERAGAVHVDPERAQRSRRTTRVGAPSEPSARRRGRQSSSYGPGSISRRSRPSSATTRASSSARWASPSPIER